MATGPDASQNRLLRSMAAADHDLLAPSLERVEMPRSTFLFRAGEQVDHVWFSEGGVLSLVAISPEGQRVEAGLFGREGFGPTALALAGDRSPFDCNVQLPDVAWRMRADRFCDVLDRSPTLRATVLRYAHVLTVQTAFTALSNAVHPVEERLARWLLMCDDRVDTGELALTHELLSIMLAVRRPSVTTALHVLEGNGLIRAERGLIRVRNRAALEEFAGDAYGAPEREYERLLGGRGRLAGHAGT